MLRAPRTIAWALLLACTPHEHPREPHAPCPPDMALVAGGTVGPTPLCVDITEVTTAAYGACVQSGTCTPAVLDEFAACNLTHADRGAHPVNCVKFEQAVAHCGWLGKRLPSDDEWVWAARPRVGGAVFPWGERPADNERACVQRGHLGTCEVGQRLPGASADGLLDLVGNVSEWTVWSEFGRLRGGDWRDPIALDVVPSTRPEEPSAEAAPTTGFRCVVAPETPVDPVDLEIWTPHRPGPVDLPVLAAPAPREAPTRPLANLDVLQKTPHGLPAGRWWPLGDGYLPDDPGAPDLLGLGDPIDLISLPEPLREYAPIRDLGDTLLMATTASTKMRLVAVEPATYKIRWQLALAKFGNSYEHFIAPRTLVAEFYGDSADMLIGFSLAAGREVWRMRGGPDGPFTRVEHLWTDGERGYIHTDRGLFAFDPATGVLLWSGIAVGDNCGVITGAGALVVETADGQGHRRLDPATGAEMRRFPTGATTCLWGLSPYDGGLAPAVLEGSRLVTFDPPDKRGAATLRALDLDTGVTLWQRRGLSHDLLVADHDAVYAARASETLVALDAATGEPRAEISIGTSHDLELRSGGGARGPLVVVNAYGAGTWILGRAEQPAVPESYRIHGRLVPDGLSRRQVAGVRVRVGERRILTDDRGRFELRGRAIGAVAVALGTDRGPDQPGGSKVRFEPVTVALDGSGTYDVGDLMLYPWYIE